MHIPPEAHCSCSRVDTSCAVTGYIVRRGALICTASGVQVLTSSNLHNHALHGSIKIAQCVQDKIASAVISNPTLRPTDISTGKGLDFTPSAVDSASAHLGKVARMVNQVKKNTAVSAKNWSPTLFESCADDLDESDFQKGNDAVEKRRLYSKLGRRRYR